MFRRERSISLRGSAAALCNNLSVLQLPAHNLTYFGVVHGPSAQILSAAPEGVPLAQRHLHAKEGAGVSPSLITQVHWCVLPFRVLLVLTSHRGIQMYESDGSIMVYWHALDSGDASPVQAVFARGIAASGHFICVGTWSGRVLVFDIPAKGPNIVLSEELAGHQTAVTDIATEPAQGQDCVADMVTADDSGLLCVWRSRPEFTLLIRIPGFGWVSTLQGPMPLCAAMAGYRSSKLWEWASTSLRGYYRNSPCPDQCPRPGHLCPGPGS
ncbi:PREDICTED: WD repeat-containing protein 54 isoform X3 [Galeopterus variegatus]|uniref:WD repeat-containing protein 54 isoform X3 n=1 Tax=Galeopterus variegatus TaxID=482537 RepID=A0ABM0R3I6_GALVR|nr:PREDICTED: WD repeat-containing protein 54 isoform X3 [Galeopterus variegatus]XP_008575178.1 PREDICTED: WD repeat-containing protein 54 isoform X3 [Galeopterus variegatus]